MFEFIKFNLLKKNMIYMMVLISLSSLLVGCGNKNEDQSLWGRAEGKEVDVNSKIPGRVVELLVKEGDRVEKGQVIARIDKRDISAQADQAKANISALTAQNNQASTVTKLQDQTSQATVTSAQAQLDKAGADLALATNDYNRFSELFNSGAVSKQVFDAYSTKYQVAEATYQQATANLKAAQAGLLQTDVNVANEKAVQSKIAQAQAALSQVEIALDESEIKAPFSGIVTTKFVEVGAMISQGMPIVTIQDPVDNWINLKVKETELSKYALNQSVKLQGRDEKLQVEGVIVDISNKPEFATYRATDERGDTDIITFNVKIQVNNDVIKPGMRFKLLS